MNWHDNKSYVGKAASMPIARNRKETIEINIYIDNDIYKIIIDIKYIWFKYSRYYDNYKLLFNIDSFIKNRKLS